MDIKSSLANLVQDAKDVMGSDKKDPAAATPATPAVPKAVPRITLDQLVDLAIEKDASDIHFGEGRRIALRISGKIVFIENISPLTKEEVEAIILPVIPNDDMRRRLDRVREIDFSYNPKQGVGFRVNAFYQKGCLSAVMRTVSKHLPTMDELSLPAELKQMLSHREGLILITGAAGSGRSLSIQAMLQYINENFVDHVITIENPIEHVFEDKKSIFSQRELGKDTLTVANAVQAALHEDPNVIMVSEINDLETFEAVLNLAETGHLVISSLLSKNAKLALERMIGFFPLVQQEQAQYRIADSISAILAQELVDRVDIRGRVCIYDFLIANHSIRSLIKHGKLDQLRTAMQSGAMEGMMTMESYATSLLEQGIISQEDAVQFSEE